MERLKRFLNDLTIGERISLYISTPILVMAYIIIYRTSLQLIGAMLYTAVVFIQSILSGNAWKPKKKYTNHVHLTVVLIVCSYNNILEGEMINLILLIILSITGLFLGRSLQMLDIDVDKKINKEEG